MKENIFTIDGVVLRLNVISLERAFSVTDTKNSGRKEDFDMYRDVAGTFYNYTLEIEPDESYRADYDVFYDMVSAPVSFHRLVFPYGQETIGFDAYVTSGKDRLRCRNETNLWEGLSVYFVAKKPQRRP